MSALMQKQDEDQKVQIADVRIEAETSKRIFEQELKHMSVKHVESIKNLEKISQD